MNHDIEIELEIETLDIEEVQFEMGGYDEFQMLAEHEMIKERERAMRCRAARQERNAA